LNGKVRRLPNFEAALARRESLPTVFSFSVLFLVAVLAHTLKQVPVQLLLLAPNWLKRNFGHLAHSSLLAVALLEAIYLDWLRFCTSCMWEDPV
jgi:hypothetical protein